MPHPIRGASSPKITFAVTQPIIDSACQRDSSHCMIAEALAAAIPAASFISVDLATIRFSDLEAGKRYVYLTPRRAQEALLQFDQGESPPPFRITLEHAHVLPTGNARNARAELVPSRKGNGKIPIRVGGESPPLGPLAGGAPKKPTPGANNGAGAGNTMNGRGRRREFGLRAIIR
jgi:hypothetical protein